MILKPHIRQVNLEDGTTVREIIHDPIALVRDRRKTSCRLPVPHLKPPLDTTKLDPRPPVKIGHVYKLRPSHRVRGTLQITVRHIQQRPLGDMDRDDLFHEGFKFAAQFETYWAATYGNGRYDPEQPVWVITFGVGDLADQFDQPRHLAATPGAVEYVAGIPSKHGAKGRWQIAPDGQEHQDYTDQPRMAMLDAGEAVPAADQQRITRQARANDNVRRLIPAHGSLERIDLEIAGLRQHLADGTGRVDRETHRDLKRLEDARDRLQRRLAS